MAIECTPAGIKLVPVDNGKAHLLLLDFATNFSKFPRAIVPAEPLEENLKNGKKPHFMYDDGIFGI